MRELSKYLVARIYNVFANEKSVVTSPDGTIMKDMRCRRFIFIKNKNVSVFFQVVNSLYVMKVKCNDFRPNYRPKFGVFSAPNAGKYGPAPYLDTFHVMKITATGYTCCSFVLCKLLFIIKSCVLFFLYIVSSYQMYPG